MDRGFVGNESSSLSSAAMSSSNSDVLLKQVNKNSHKIAKPIRKTPPPPPAPSSSPAVPLIDQIPQLPGQHQSQSHQPPVYNINKNDFRDVVQKLTGSPAPPPPPPPVSQTRPTSSRLQRIRPPPLSEISNRPPPFTQVVPLQQPLTPLPPLPSVHTAAESPISAYMRFLKNSASSSGSSLWSGVAPVDPHPYPLLPQKTVAEQHQPVLPPPSVESPISAYMRLLQTSGYPSSTASPQPLGCIPSPRSQYGLLSPCFLLSPTGQLRFPQLPLSPSLPVPKPR